MESVSSRKWVTADSKYTFARSAHASEILRSAALPGYVRRIQRAATRRAIVGMVACVLPTFSEAPVLNWWKWNCAIC